MPAPPGHERPEQEPKKDTGTRYEDVGEGYVSGNVTRELTLRFTPDGRAVATVRVAETERVKDPASGAWTDGETQFFDVVAWGDMAGHLVESVTKGDRIVASGKWQKQTWQDEQGEPRSKIVLIARDAGPSCLFRKVIIDRTKRGNTRP